MPKTSVVGFPRIGEKRELKFALERYFGGSCGFSEVESVASELKKRHWKRQRDAGVELISSNDFSYYDNMLDTAVMLGAIPERFRGILDVTKRYFAMARGFDGGVAMAMSKWFNTNYHYIVPELYKDMSFLPDASKIVDEYNEAKSLGVETKINIIGPVTFLALSRAVDGSDRFLLFSRLIVAYEELLGEIAKLGSEIVVQFEEPYFVKDVDASLLGLLKEAYERLGCVSKNIKIVVATYFERSNEATSVLLHTPIWALSLDFVAGPKNMDSIDLIAKSDKTLIAGVINGRNVWRVDFDESLDLLKAIGSKIPKDRLILSTSCSLLHSPYSLEYETKIDSEIKSSLSFAYEKLDELVTLSKLFFGDELSEVQKERLLETKKAINSRKTSQKIHNEEVKKRVANIQKWEREGKAKERLKLQREVLRYPNLATTTIGSFPQTQELRVARKEYKDGLIDEAKYKEFIRGYIDEAIKIQEEIGLDVLVHGEPERVDMVEYFGQLMRGFAFSENGWVQSYGTRCVKPPLLFGDVSALEPMTLEWITYAQSKTQKIVKGMLTGPVTIINWSFVRDDIQKDEVAYQIALVLADEIDALQKAGIKIVQVDEAAFKEGYPLRAENVAAYEEWALKSFKLSVSSARKETQIHTHMCYSEFDDIIHTIEAMDADVITIETAKSGNRLLRVFKETGYTKEIGPGVYDIHSPRVPSKEEIEAQISSLLEVLPKEQLWINPDCGLKTRKWEEVVPALTNMVEAVKKFR